MVFSISLFSRGSYISSLFIRVLSRSFFTKSSFTITFHCSVSKLFVNFVHLSKPQGKCGQHCYFAILVCPFYISVPLWPCKKTNLKESYLLYSKPCYNSSH